MRTIGYLGPRGTFSHSAALIYSNTRGYKPVCCVNLQSVVQRVAAGDLACGIVPVENSLGGAVVEIQDLLTVTEGIYINDEISLPVNQHLLVRPGAVLSGIKKVYSHPQALAQCRHFLKQHLPGIPVVETGSTAAAALKVAGAGSAELAAIGSRSAACTYGLQILRAGIQDSTDNTTRFLVLGKEKDGAGRGCAWERRS